jgi:hypothetical protein
VVAEGFNLFNADVSEIGYFYRSRLPHEPADGVDDVHLHPGDSHIRGVAIQFVF